MPYHEHAGSIFLQSAERGILATRHIRSAQRLQSCKAAPIIAFSLIFCGAALHLLCEQTEHSGSFDSWVSNSFFANTVLTEPGTLKDLVHAFPTLPSEITGNMGGQPYGTTFAQPLRKSNLPRLRATSDVVEAEVVTIADELPQTLPVASARVDEGMLDMIVIGAGIAGLWFALTLVSKLKGSGRVRIYDPRLESGQDGLMQWNDQHVHGGHRVQVAHLPVKVWKRLPTDVQTTLFGEGAFVEQWPVSLKRNKIRSKKFHSRNISVGILEDCLLETVQRLPYSHKIELISSEYTNVEHKRVIQDRPFHAVAVCDGQNAQNARDTIFIDSFGKAVPRMDSLGPAETLAVVFDLGFGKASADVTPELSIAAGTAISIAQSRYMLSWSSKTCGVLHMRLTRCEAAELKEWETSTLWEKKRGHFCCPTSGCTWDATQSSLVWPRMLQGLKLYGIPETSIRSGARFTAAQADWPTFNAGLPDLRSPSGAPPFAFLIGEAVRAGTAFFGPGVGPAASIESAHSLVRTLARGGADSLRSGRVLMPHELTDHATLMARAMYRERDVSGFGPTERIEAELTSAGGASIDDARQKFLALLQDTLERLTPKELSPERAAELPSWPSLRKYITSAGLDDETFRILIASGPATINFNSRREPSRQDETPEVFDFGGETADGLQQAAYLKSLANTGHADALFDLGVMYFTANGVNKDEPKAFKLLMRAAKSGHAQSQNCVGSMLRNGLITKSDKKQAASWFKKAAKQGDVEAAYNLGEMFYEGDGIEQDEEQAVRWLGIAAKKGLSHAQYKLGHMLHTGDGVDVDKGRSVRFIQQAAEQGLPEALHMLGSLHFEGDGVTLDKIAAAKYFLAAAEKGDAVAQYSIGVMLEIGDGVTQNAVQSEYWIRQAAAQGLIEAQAQCRERPALTEGKGG